jgi:hypothetical protein
MVPERTSSFVVIGPRHDRTTIDRPDGPERERARARTGEGFP